MSLDLDDLLGRLKLVGGKGSFDLLEAITAPPVVTQTIDGASTLTIEVSDSTRKLIRSEAVQERSWAVAAGVHFELVQLAKVRNRYTLTFEDAIVAALRRRDKPLSIKAGTSTRREITLKLAKEAGVKAVVDPTHKGKVRNAVHRSTRKEKSNSWDCLGTEVAEPIQWRRFSNGKQLVVGGDEWLLARDATVTRLREYTGGVHDIDFDLDVGKKVATATVTVDADLWSVPPGDACTVEDLGPADGRWLVSEFTRSLTSTRGTVKLVRRRHTLKEPKRETTRVRGGAQGGDDGEPDFLPDKTGTAPPAPTTAPATSSSARERMVQFALAQQGDAYVWGASGPSSWDCSGLVQEATRAAGKVLSKPSDSQWAQMVSAGATIPLDQGINTRGAILHRDGHIVISLGNGSTIEAMGTAYGVLIGSASGRFTGAGLWI